MKKSYIIVALLGCSSFLMASHCSDQQKKELNMQLIKAVFVKDAAGTREQLLRGADSNAKTFSGQRILDFCTRMDELDCLRELISAGANLNYLKSNGWSALHTAARWSRLACMKELIMQGAQIDIRDSLGRTPLVLSGESFESLEAMLRYYCLQKFSEETVKASWLSVINALANLKTLAICRKHPEASKENPFAGFLCPHARMAFLLSDVDLRENLITVLLNDLRCGDRPIYKPSLHALDAAVNFLILRMRPSFEYLYFQHKKELFNPDTIKENFGHIILEGMSNRIAEINANRNFDDNEEEK